MTVPSISSAPPTVSLRSTSAMRLPSDHDPGENNDGVWRATGQSFRCDSRRRHVRAPTRLPGSPRKQGSRKPRESSGGLVSLHDCDAPTAPSDAAAENAAERIAALPAVAGRGGRGADDVRVPDAADARCAPRVAQPVPDPGLLAVRARCRSRCRSGRRPVWHVSDAGRWAAHQTGAAAAPTGADGTGPPGTVLQRGIQLAVHPLASRALFGMPASELTREVLELDEVVGRPGDALRERLTGPIDPAIAARAGVGVDRRSGWREPRPATRRPNYSTPGG